MLVAAALGGLGIGQLGPFLYGLTFVLTPTSRTFSIDSRTFGAVTWVFLGLAAAGVLLAIRAVRAGQHQGRLCAAVAAAGVIVAGAVLLKAELALPPGLY